MSNNSFENIQFKFPWRNYQQNFLANFSSHISDNHFHVIAPPGSGKTVLGLEIIKRLNKKTLVLTPTLTIRNQWEDRLQNFFTTDHTYPHVSFDIRNLSIITFSTYQSLHAFYKTFDNKEDYYAYFRNHNVETLVFDEAHHLKNEWWKCLYELKQSSFYIMVALTATPPYDSERSEITKYFKLCGEIDDEIATPDLVKEKNLCPHQDFVYFSKPNDLEINYIVDFRRNISAFVDSLTEDQEFIRLIKSHRFYKDTINVLDELYEKPNLFSAILIFLKAANQIIPFEKLETLGFEKEIDVEIPELSNRWVEILLQNLIVADRDKLTENEEYLQYLEKQVKKLNVFENKRVDLVGNKNIYRSLSSSPSKLKSITKIVKHESHHLREGLRCVILTDYIRNEFLNVKENEIADINKLGVIPIFQNLRISLSKKNKIGVLTGSIVIIHASILADFNLILDESSYSLSPLISDSEYVSIKAKKSGKNKLVSTITELFELGKITIIIGTKSLLGEGWDAPAINTLVLASFVGSFVTSNQMRGRAIRVQKDNPNKTGNIWHLACIDPTTEDGGKDFEILKRRFNTFLGISNTKEPYISTGLDRLELPNISGENLEETNLLSLKLASNRDAISKNWKLAVFDGNKLAREVKFFHQGKKPYQQQKKLFFNDAVKYAFVELTITLSIFLPEFLLKNFNVLLNKGWLYFFYTLLAFLGLNFGSKTYKAVKLYVQYGMIHKEIDKMARTILGTLNELGYLSTNHQNIKIESKLLSFGDVTCSIHGTNQIESTLFINALDEILQPIANPRYLIVKSNWLRHKLKIQNYFVVPKLFGDKKNRCEVFLKHWISNLGKSNIFYTRTLEGRKMLLKARLFHVSNTFKEVTKKSVLWK